MQKFLVMKPGRKRPRGNPRRKWKDNIKMILKQKCEGGDCVQ